MVGIAGPPASGKSTLADHVTQHLNKKAGVTIAQLVQMDGFHFPNKILEMKGLATIKGTPITFDSSAFVRLLEDLKRNSNRRILYPIYDRGLHAPIKNAFAIESHHQVVVIERNYLLIDESPWDRIADLLDHTWHLEIEPDQARERLMARHLRAGRALSEATLKVESVDLQNLKHVNRFKGRASRIVSQTEIDQFMRVGK